MDSLGRLTVIIVFYKYLIKVRDSKPKPSMMTIPFISVYKLTSRTPRSFSKIKLFAQHISLLTFLVFVIAEEVNIKLNNAN